MTCPDERSRAVVSLGRVATDMVIGNYKRADWVQLRHDLRAALRHYPSKWEIQQIPAGRGKIFFGQIE